MRARSSSSCVQARPGRRRVPGVITRRGLRPAAQRFFPIPRGGLQDRQLPHRRAQLEPADADPRAKFFDADADGVDTTDPLEVAIPGWRVEILRAGVLDGVTFTDDNGGVRVPARSRRRGTRCAKWRPAGSSATTSPAQCGWRRRRVSSPSKRTPPKSWFRRSATSASACSRSSGARRASGTTTTDARCSRTAIRSGAMRSPLGTARRCASGATCRARTRWPRSSLRCRRPRRSAPPSTTSPPWIVASPSSGHAGFILSTQVAAAVLNRNCGDMQFNAYIDRFQNGVLVSLDDMLTGVQQLLCDPGAGSDGSPRPNQALRAAASTSSARSTTPAIPTRLRRVRTRRRAASARRTCSDGAAPDSVTDDAAPAAAPVPTRPAQRWPRRGSRSGTRTRRRSSSDHRA